MPRSSTQRGASYRGGNEYYDDYQPRSRGGNSSSSSTHNYVAPSYSQQGRANYRSRGRTSYHDSYESSSRQYDSSSRQYDSSRGRRPGRSRGGAHKEVIELCNYFTITGECRRGSSCKYSHILRCCSYTTLDQGLTFRDGLLKFADGFALRNTFDASLKANIPAADTPIIVLPLPPVEIYTLCSDKSMKLHNIDQDKNSDPKSALLLNLNLTKSISLNENPSCIHQYRDVLFVGFVNGAIKAFSSSTGQALDLVGHKSAVLCITVFQEIVVSSEWEGKIVFWKFCEQRQTFAEIGGITIEGKVCRLLPVYGSVGDVVGRFLWVAGSVLILVDLNTLQICQQFDLIALRRPQDKAEPVVHSLIEFEKHVVAALGSGDVIVLEPHGGPEKHIHRGDPSSIMQGVLGPSAAYIACANATGNLQLLKLPLFENCGACCISDTGARIRFIADIGNSCFLTGGDDGAMCIWQITA